jgi:shikimate kinase
MGLYDCLLVGHRGTGKSTTGARLAALGWAVVDLDQEIETIAGQSCSELVASNPTTFREIETHTLQLLVRDSVQTPRIIVCGAGAMNLPDEALVVWLRRPGWTESARNERTPLRPEIPFEEEVDWMTQSREPIWSARADFVFDIPLGRIPDRVAREISDVLRWAKSGGEVPHKTWLIASAPVARLRFLIGALSLKGVETRSDLSAPYPDDVPLLASLRTPEPEWLAAHSKAEVFDIDIAYLPGVIESGVLDALKPRPLILSTHPTEITSAVQENLARAKATFCQKFPTWLQIQTKCAGPGTLEAFQPIDDIDTILPTSGDLNWLRTLNAFTNSQNYLAAGVKASRIDSTLADTVPPMDLQDWALYFGTDGASARAGLVGDPVQKSQGPWWHRAAAEKAGQTLTYLTIPVATTGLGVALEHLQKQGVTRLSVTSPLKIEAAQICQNALSALNTLKFDHQWIGTDTDTQGAAEALKEVQARGLKAGSVLVIGTGGVAAAVLRALQESAFHPITHLPGRHRGAWPETDLVINASGHRPKNPPHPQVWLDLHYNGVEAIDVEVHLNGDTFFEGQAQAQRRFWGLED